jgi:competence protein ComEC
MHWTAVGFGLGIAAYFGMFHEPGALVFLASSLVAGLSVSLAVRFRDGIARFLIVIAAVAAGFAWCQYRAHAVFGPVLSDRFYGAVQGRVIGIDRSLSERPRLTLDELVLETVSRQATPRRIRVALHGMAQEHIPQIGDTVLLAAHLSPPPGPAEPYGYDFQRQAWFAQLGGVGYTRSPVMTWRAAPADRDGLTVQKWRQKIGAHMARICRPAPPAWLWLLRWAIGCIWIETCSKRFARPIFRIFWRYLACIWACSPVWCSF